MKKKMIIFKKTSGLFPIHANILGRDQTKIRDTAAAPVDPAPVVPVAPVALVGPPALLGPYLMEITTSLKSIAKRSEDKKGTR